MSDAQSEAAKKAAARRAKILARGNTGLNKLAQTARGEDADKLYGSDTAASSRPETPVNQPTRSAAAPAAGPTPAQTSPSWAPPPGAAGSGASAEQRQMAEQLQAMMSMLGGGAGPQGVDGAPDMSQFFAQMMGQQGAGTPASNLLGDVDDPAGLGGAPSPAAGFGGGMGMPNFPGMENLGMGGMGGMPSPPAAGKKWAERVFPIVHALAMLALMAFVVIWWEPSLRGMRAVGKMDAGWGSRWGRLAGRKGSVGDLKAGLLGSIEVLPIFYAFTTLELILQTTRFMIFKSPPPPHALLNNFLPILPPKIARPLLTGSRYLNLLTQMFKDGCLLVFLIGMVIAGGEYASSRSAVRF